MSITSALASRVGVNERTVRRAVDRGLVRATRPTPNKLRVEQGESEWLLEHWGLVSVLLRTLRTEPNVVLAILFGSVARGEETEHSDVDVLVALHRDDLTAASTLEDRLAAAIDRPVQVVRLSRARHDAEFLLGVVDEGRVLVDRGPLWPSLRRSRAHLARAADGQSRQRREAIERDLAEALG
jgi:predicted nucleotidyltransferase